VRSDLRANLQAKGSKIANTSPFSPLFRLLGAVFAAPVLYLRALVVDTVLPRRFCRPPPAMRWTRWPTDWT
jgi:hypothetical protein